MPSITNLTPHNIWNDITLNCNTELVLHCKFVYFIAVCNRLVDMYDHNATLLLTLTIANTKKKPGCYVSRCYVGSCGGNIVSGARAGVTGEACTYVYMYWFTFIIVRPAQWQLRKNDPVDYWSQLNVNWKLGNDESANIKPRKCGTGTFLYLHYLR